MDVKEIQTFLEQNKENEEIKIFLDSFKVQPTLEVFKNKFESDKDFKAFMDSEKDKHAEKSLKTWRENNLEKLLNEEIKKRFPEADPKDLELKKLQAQIENMQKETLRKDLTNKAIKVATEKKLPVELVDFLVGQDEETTNKNIEKLESVFNAQLETLVQERLKGSSYTPPDTKIDVNNTYESLLKNADNMTAEQVAEMFSNMGK